MKGPNNFNYKCSREVKNIVNNIARKKDIKKKYEELKKKKFLESLECRCPCDNIKSVGNGL